MPCYPALALLLGSALATKSPWIRRGTRFLTIMSGVAAVVCLAILFMVRHLPAPGDIARALSEHPSAYTLSLGHMEDLTLTSFAYLRIPLAVAAMAFLIGCIGTFIASGRHALIVAGIMMVVFFHAARLALVVFDPYMSSRPLADALLQSPPGELIVDHHYYDFSSVFFYTNRRALLLNGRFNNMVYGSYAPDAPDVFIDNTGFQQRWSQPGRYYVVAELPGVERMEKLVDRKDLNVVTTSGGKFLLTNHPLPGTSLINVPRLTNE